jgi:hypothetical protein
MTSHDDANKSSGSPILRDSSFIQNVILLFLTAALSGVIVPQVVKTIDTSRESRAAVQRAQAKLFSDVSETVLTYETLALDVSWFGTNTAKNPEMQRKAFERYSDKVVDLTAKWRIQASRAQTLTSRPVSAKINNLLAEVFVKQDTPINALWNRCASTCDWDTLHVQNEQVLGDANTLIAQLATDLGLVTRSSETSTR